MSNLVGPINLYIDVITNREYSPAKKEEEEIKLSTDSFFAHLGEKIMSSEVTLKLSFTKIIFEQFEI